METEGHDVTDSPKLPKTEDGIYPRCVWCGGEGYAPAVIEYSRRLAPCYICGLKLPPEYVSLPAR
jgi:hypothetical protein